MTSAGFARTISTALEKASARAHAAAPARLTSLPHGAPVALHAQSVAIVGSYLIAEVAGSVTLS